MKNYRSPVSGSWGSTQNSFDQHCLSLGTCIKLVLVFLLALIGRILDAAPAADLDEAEKASQRRSTSTIFSRDFPTIVALGPGVAFLDDLTGWSFNVNGATQFNVDQPLFYGLDFAITIWRPSETDQTTGIQLLPTAYYLFEVLNTAEVYPYFGVSVGPIVKVRRVGMDEHSDTFTDLNLMVLFRSGLAVSLAANAWFHFEPKFGLMAGRMIFQPQVSAAFLF